MYTPKREIVIICASVILIVAIGLVFRSVTNNSYRSRLPAPPDLNLLNASLRNQISMAYETAKRNPSSGNIGRLGMVYHSSAVYDKAAKCYQLAISRNSRRWVWNYYLGYLDKEMGDNSGVISNFAAVVRKNPKDYIAWFYIAEGNQALGKNNEAEAIYRKVIAEAGEISGSENSFRRDFFPIRAYARFQLATIYLNTRKLVSADSTIRVLLKDQPSFGQAYRLLGSVYNLQGDQESSKKCLLRAGDLMIYTPPVDTIVDILAQNSRSDIYLLKQIDDAEKGGYSHFAAALVNNALKDIPDNKFVISKAIKIFLVMDLNGLADPLFDRHLEYFGSDISELKMVADLCMKKGLNKQAVKYYLQAARLQPEDISVHLSVALCLGKDGAVNQAGDSVGMVVKKHCDNLKIMTDCAYVLLMLGEKDKADVILSDLAGRYHSDPKVQQLTGILKQQNGKEDEALKLFESSFKGDPKDLSTARYLNDILMKRNKWNEAITCIRTALEFSPNDPNLQESLGSLLVFCPDEKLRNISEGWEYSERAFINKSSTRSTMVSAGMSLAQASYQQGDRDEAVKVMKIAIDLAGKQNAPGDFIQDLQKRLESYRK